MSDESIRGKCPSCKRSADFRELTFSENLGGLGAFLGGALLGGAVTKKRAIKTVANEMFDNRSFPNYVCESCGVTVMQCSHCDEIMRYAHDGSNHICK